MTDAAPYSVPKEPGRWRAISLAVVVHLALFAFLWIGVRWQNETPVGVEAEVWSPQNQEAAPRPEPPPAAEEKPVPAPPPEPQPVVKEIPKPPVVEPAQKNPDIALEQEKKRKAQEKREREEQEKQAKLKQQKLEQKLEQEREEKLERQQAENERIKKEKADALAKQKAEAQAQAQKEKEKAEAQARKLAADKKRKQDAQEAAAADQRRAEDMKRMLAQAGTGGAGSAATAQGSRADTSYTQKVGARIKSNTVFNVPEGLAGNPAVEFAVELLPDGSIRALNKVKSSGVPGFDEAVQRAIGKSAPFPPDKTGRVPAGFNVVHHPKDQ